MEGGWGGWRVDGVDGHSQAARRSGGLSCGQACTCIRACGDQPREYLWSRQRRQGRRWQPQVGCTAAAAVVAAVAAAEEAAPEQPLRSSAAQAQWLRLRQRVWRETAKTAGEQTQTCGRGGAGQPREHQWPWRRQGRQPSDGGERYNRWGSGMAAAVAGAAVWPATNGGGGGGSSKGVLALVAAAGCRDARCASSSAGGGSRAGAGVELF